MIRFDNLPIRRKLAVIVLLGIAIAIGVTAITILLYDRAKIRVELAQELRVLAGITSQRSSAALMFRDHRAIAGNLDALLLKDSIEFACVYDTSGELFSGVDRRFPESPRCVDQLQLEPGISFGDAQVTMVDPVAVRERTIGKLLINANLDEIKDRSLQFVLLVSLVAVVSAVIAYIVTNALTRRVSRPIADLTAVASHIRNFEDYSVRAQKQGNDEVGTLVDIFNAMVLQIQDSQMRLGELVMELKERSDQSEAQAEKMAKRHDAIREFFSGVSHDLRQPLQAIDMYVSVLRTVRSDGERAEIHDKLQQAVANLGNMFRELLDVARFEAKVEQTLVRERVELGEVLRRVADEFEVLAGEKGLRFGFYPRDCTVLSEATMLERVVRNLVSNAVRYTDGGGILLGVRIRRGEAVVEVWDTGRGIPADKLDSVFQQFVQVQDKDAEQGYGLGLSIVRRLVSALGHKLELDSREGSGTVFRLRMTLAPPLESEERVVAVTPATAPVTVSPADAIASVSAQVEALTAAVRVVIVDDDPMVLDSISLLLRSWDMSVEAFGTAQALRDWAQGKPSIPTVIISDFHVGEVDRGDELIKEVRSLLGTEVPGLIISGTTSKDDLQRIRDAGFQVLAKPVKPPRLRALMNFLMTQSPPA